VIGVSHITRLSSPAPPSIRPSFPASSTLSFPPPSLSLRTRGTSRSAGSQFVEGGRIGAVCSSCRSKEVESSKPTVGSRLLLLQSLSLPLQMEVVPGGRARE